jgi:hypothetical protein
LRRPTGAVAVRRLIKGTCGAVAVAVPVALALALVAVMLPGRSAAAAAPWNFAVSGDSRNCGDVVMPSIAAGALAGKAAFYWHLGDLRAIYDFDEDFRAIHPKATIHDYLATAWPDVERNQIAAFGTLPFFLGIGNHETIPPKTRDEFLLTFADWLDAAPIREQRLRDDPNDHGLRAYYHWRMDGVDFINLDNATPDEFDSEQLAWLNRTLQGDEHDGTVRAVVVGMHEALPESLARGHSMSDHPATEAAGRQAYEALLAVRRTKPVYVLASHSHYVMDSLFDTAYWREHGGVLPGWIVGTGGAVRYPLPPDAPQAKLARTRVYGYLLATVSPARPNDQDPIHFEFREVTEGAVPAGVAQRFGPELMRFCYQENARD